MPRETVRHSPLTKLQMASLPTGQAGAQSATVKARGSSLFWTEVNRLIWRTIGLVESGSACHQFFYKPWLILFGCRRVASPPSKTANGRRIEACKDARIKPSRF